MNTRPDQGATVGAHVQEAAASSPVDGQPGIRADGAVRPGPTTRLSAGPGLDPAGLPTVEVAFQEADQPDPFGRLWTAHRMVYIGGQDKPVDSTPAHCPFCVAPGRSDTDSLIVYRGEHAYVLMNLYPYNTGHLLVCPYRHVSDWTQASDTERIEIGRLTARAMEVVRAVSHPHGFNLGMNQGAVAGAGIAAHLHQHIVPRWTGDANFMPIIGKTKPVPQLLGDQREMLAAAWDSAPRTHEEAG